MNAVEIVDKIGNGVLDALDTCELFLGIEELSNRNPHIHPEYVTTVMVGRRLTGIDRWVSLEARMRDLRHDALAIGRLRTLNTRTASCPALDHKVIRSQHRFGKQRLDILVREASNNRAPLLVAEAKLGVRNVRGVINDVNRLVKLFRLYDDAGALGAHVMYGAAVFHVMQERGTPASLHTRAQNLLAKVQGHFASLSSINPKLYFNAGLLTHTLKCAGASGYEEPRHDGSVEKVFEKHGYAFQAGLILIGNAADVKSVTF